MSLYPFYLHGSYDVINIKSNTNKRFYYRRQGNVEKYYDIHILLLP